MKPVLLVAMLAGLFMPLYGQQQWCFSKTCPETPATMFTLDRSDKQLNNIFRPLATLPAYQPVAPLAFSPSTKQFFQYSVPTDVGHGLGLAGPGNVAAMVETNHGGTIGTHSPAGLKSSHRMGPTFSTGQGGMVFTPASPRF